MSEYFAMLFIVEILACCAMFFMWVIDLPLSETDEMKRTTVEPIPFRKAA